jgi:hypothetical protein
MATNNHHLLLILSNPTAGKDDEFNAWYDEHLDHVLEVPGIETAQRFRFSDDQFPADVIPPSRHAYLTIYEVSLPPSQVMPALLDPSLAEGLPDAFDHESERAWWYTVAGDRVGPAVEQPSHKLVVFSNPASPALDGELNEWYDEHLHEVIGLDAGVVNAQRFRLSDEQFPAAVTPPSEHRYLALYDTNVSPAKTCGTLAAAMDGYEHPHALDLESLRDWMFTAVGSRRVAAVGAGAAASAHRA